MDGLGIGLRRLTSILVGLSYAPCLGNRPHRSPSPIHWADGFADVSNGIYVSSAFPVKTSSLLNGSWPNQ